MGDSINYICLKWSFDNRQGSIWYSDQDWRRVQSIRKRLSWGKLFSYFVTTYWELFCTLWMGSMFKHPWTIWKINGLLKVCNYIERINHLMMHGMYGCHNINYNCKIVWWLKISRVEFKTWLIMSGVEISRNGCVNYIYIYIMINYMYILVWTGKFPYNWNLLVGILKVVITQPWHE